MSQTKSLRFTRRRVLAGATAGLCVSGSTVSANPAVARTFVLVHGGWRGGWCWRRVADRLLRAGHTVYTPTLTGLADRSHLLTGSIGLTTHVTDIVNLIRWENLTDIVLAGHSYGGSVISAAVERSSPSIRSMVFVDAFVPERGEAIIDLSSKNPRDAIKAALANGETSVAPVPAAFFNLNEADRAWVDEKSTPQPISTFTEPVGSVDARERIKTKIYIRATGYLSEAFDAAAAKVRGRAGWTVHTLPCGHDIMLDMPAQLTNILLDASGTLR